MKYFLHEVISCGNREMGEGINELENMQELIIIEDG